MRISIIGAGRVAYHLIHILKTSHQIIDIYNRDIEKAYKLSAMIKANAVDDFAHLNQDVDLFMIAVSDQAIESVVKELTNFISSALIVHTSGSTHLDVLKKYYARCGVFYPLQTFSFESAIDWEKTPIFIEAALSKDLETLCDVAKEFSSKIYTYNSEQRMSLHLAAVFACNFTNYCYDMAYQVVSQHNVDFNLLHPLILETAKKATLNIPETVQTGPAVRGDLNIMNLHQNILNNFDGKALFDSYNLLSKQIMNKSKN